jgi:Fur family transcriptional regulator, ferric uptake regulator
MLRRTRQRQAVQDVFAKAEGPLGPHEVVAAARNAASNLGIATVYRTIRELLNAGWLVSVATPNGTRFDLAAHQPHHYFYCSVCAKTFHVEGCVGSFDHLIPPGFVANEHQLTIIGTCGACALQGGGS